MPPDIEGSVRSALRPLRVSWSVMLAVSLCWAGLGLLASPVVSSSPSPPTTAWPTALTILGVFFAAVTVVIDRMVITPQRMAALIPVYDGALVQRHLLAGHLVLWSFAQLPALFGFAQLFLGGALNTHLALCAGSLALLAFLMPTRTRIAVRMETVLR